MAAIAGYNGSVAWSAGVYNSDTAGVSLNVRTWSLDYVADTLDTTDFTSTGDRTFISGLRSWSGTCESLLDGTASPLGDASDLGSLDSVSDVITITASSGKTYSGTAFVTGIHPSVAVDGVNTVTVDFQGTGAITIA